MVILFGPREKGDTTIQLIGVSRVVRTLQITDNYGSSTTILVLEIYVEKVRLRLHRRKTGNRIPGELQYVIPVPYVRLFVSIHTCAATAVARSSLILRRSSGVLVSHDTIIIVVG